METLIFHHVTLTPSDMPSTSLGQPACLSPESSVLKGCTMIWVTLFGHWPEDPSEHTTVAAWKGEDRVEERKRNQKLHNTAERQGKREEAVPETFQVPALLPSASLA